ncbi:hypothetical protein FQA47_022108 [Oryzias melastigma]|uniref:Uncharacterized protein n=1 Tax=Oryzias melastigma TaxID=30732 RepID=A0A834C6G8_ORYME|nr:hypothetical protein FQA47_022108 [Oryzias melastigma]
MSKNAIIQFQEGGACPPERPVQAPDAQRVQMEPLGINWPLSFTVVRLIPMLLSMEKVTKFHRVMLKHGNAKSPSQGLQVRTWTII